MNALPLHFLMLIFAGWLNRHQQEVIEYFQEETLRLPKRQVEDESKHQGSFDSLI